MVTVVTTNGKLSFPLSSIIKISSSGNSRTVYLVDGTSEKFEMDDNNFNAMFLRN